MRPTPGPPGAPRRDRNSLARPRRAAASSDSTSSFCERGNPLSHFPPDLAGSERSSLPSIFVACLDEHHPGVGRRKKIGTEQRTRGRSGALRAGIATPLRALGARRRVPIRRRHFCERGSSPFHTFLLISRSANKVRCHQSLLLAWCCAVRPHGMQARERRPPVGTAARSAADGVNAEWRHGAHLGNDSIRRNGVQARERQLQAGTAARRAARASLSILYRRHLTAWSNPGKLHPLQSGIADKCLLCCVHDSIRRNGVQARERQLQAGTAARRAARARYPSSIVAT